jgi:DNA-binding SARP family transcriptional activator
VAIGDADVAVPGERLRTLLAALLLRPGQVVASDTLLYDVWGEDLPSNPRSALQAAISRLRSALQLDLRHEQGGYRIELEGHDLDLVRFRDNVAAAADADLERRVELLTDALRDHEGDVLRDASTGTLARRFGPGLRDEWLEARERRAEARLLLGELNEALTELTAVTTLSPLREQAWSLLLKGLHHAGRSAEALATYEKVRQMLAEELGAAPSTALQDLHQVILAGERAAGWTTRTRLPLPVTGFIGREDEIAKALELLGYDGLPVLVLSGLAGVGKTALAVRIGHAVNDLFPDGRWLVRLHGRPVDDVLVELLGFCGITSDTVPVDPSARIELFREALDGRRVLLILDDATSAAEVEALLPNAAGCAVIVTSRRSLGELAVTAGASGTLLQPLSLVQSTGFLRQSVPAAGSAVVDDLAGLCAGLPLALRIAAASARALPPERLTTYVSRLRGDRLAGLSRAVGGQGIRASFDLSYDALPDRLRRLFGLLGLHPGNDVGPGVAAALLGADLATAATALDQLAEAGLLISTDLDRYSFHDLVREYATGLPVDDPEPAIRRMLDWYLASGVNARQILYAGGAEQYVDALDSVPAAAQPSSELEAYDWFDTEWDNLVAAVWWTGAHGHADRSWQLAAVTWPYVSHRRRWQDHRDLYSYALQKTREQGRQDGEVWVLGRLGNAQLYSGDRSAASTTFQEMRLLSRTIEDRRAEAAAVRGSALVLHWTAADAAALELYREALEIEVEPIGRADTLNNVADCLYHLGELEAARAAALEAVEIYRSAGNRLGGAIVRGTLAEICLAQGDLDDARQYIAAALAVVRELGAVVLEAEATSILALIHQAEQDDELARRTARRAADLLRDAGANVLVRRISHLVDQVPSVPG